MASTLPLQRPVDHQPLERTDIVVSEHEPSGILQAMASETAQEILTVLGEEPGTVSEVADAVGTSLQNAGYHLERLAEADLIETVDTQYSRKGREMTIYGLTADELVIHFGR